MYSKHLEFLRDDASALYKSFFQELRIYTFEEIKKTITQERVYIKEIVNFKIPETCAFTVESRLEDLNYPDLPSVYFHFIVCFDKGKKIILENFDQIFKAVGMDYMNSK